MCGAVCAQVLIADSGALVEGGSFTYQTAANITAVSPTQGQQGTQVNVTGTNLYGGGTRIASATLGGVPATIVFESETFVQVRAGNDVLGGGLDTVSLTSDTGTYGLSTAPNRVNVYK